ncbi:ribonuclease PH [endosymbiont 'TC1' of Trimyema compressum]|uniref:ribonuclease PH n=1 Tax=endosymbiont 'TC1' of Trimyema compressum TaxID=243899 RepID=UPI0007F15F41|nr:ribonuclease PH [endosymbiont 'TC1' of Trimyema compressum]AMP20444.1 ribonuclease PH [endosymbiont 'TC1' of Trimyema compressum]
MKNNSALRDVSIKRNVLLYPEGSCLIEVGNTKVLITATIEEKVPPFLEGKLEGWVTAEYSMLPRDNKHRTLRGFTKGKLDGRSAEIKRLIGRSLRAIVNRKALGPRTIILDCVMFYKGDGGTLCASITGAFVALYDACEYLLEKEMIDEMPLNGFLAAVSVGKSKDDYILDLCYEEDVSAIVDLNLVMKDDGELIEIQGTGEGGTFSRNELGQFLDLGEQGIKILIEKQKAALGVAE